MAIAGPHVVFYRVSGAGQRKDPCGTSITLNVTGIGTVNQLGIVQEHALCLINLMRQLEWTTRTTS